MSDGICPVGSTTDRWIDGFHPVFSAILTPFQENCNTPPKSHTRSAIPIVNYERNPGKNNSLLVKVACSGCVPVRCVGSQPFP